MTTTHTTTQATENVEQWRLPRQAAAPEGPVDVKMMYVMHHAFRRDLVMFAEAAAVTPADDREVWRALSRRWQIFSEILHHHHSGEDAGLWPWLLRVADADERATLDAMEAEHAEIDPILSACAKGFERVTTATDPWIAHELPSDAVAELLTDAGTPMRVIWLATRRRFERLDARATRHV